MSRTTTPPSEAKCETCGGARMLDVGSNDNANIVSCPDCAALPATDARSYCPKCKGQGVLSTGILEIPNTQCDACNGTGFATPASEAKCATFCDDPDAPGCCALCGNPTEAHCAALPEQVTREPDLQTLVDALDDAIAGVPIREDYVVAILRRLRSAPLALTEDERLALQSGANSADCIAEQHRNRAQRCLLQEAERELALVVHFTKQAATLRNLAAKGVSK